LHEFWRKPQLGVEEWIGGVEETWGGVGGSQGVGGKRVGVMGTRKRVCERPVWWVWAVVGGMWEGGGRLQVLVVVLLMSVECQ